jgi:GT2 family glycosyltransferase
MVDTLFTLIMPTTSWEGTFPICFNRLKLLVEADHSAGFASEIIVVLDGPQQPIPVWLSPRHARIVATGQRSGPARARNLAAGEAGGDVLVFVDADVELHLDSLQKFRRAFREDPSLDAIFGSYDDTPAAPGLVSQFRNLLHHHTHQHHRGPASTFWAGCGAMRRDRFLELGGFATAYDHPSIEDVELGLRLWRQGGRIVLDPGIQGCHHKRWTLRSMLVTDIRRRAMPWSRLLLEQGDTPATLNLSRTGQLSGALAPLVPLGLALMVVPGGRVPGAILAGTALLLLVWLNQSFHRLHGRRRGWADAIVGVGLHLLHLCSASGTFALMAGLHHVQRPLSWPRAFQERPALRCGLVMLALMALSLVALLALGKGLKLGWTNAMDLKERLREWQHFRRGDFPMGGIYGGHPPQGIRASPYPLWAIPLFAFFFYPWDLPQGILTIQILSLLSLAFIARTGFLHLRGHGKAAGWLGALGPLAIGGNANALAVAQFSILCIGLVFLEWRKMRAQQPLAAGFCWALAMIKPQIALFHGAPFLFNKRMRAGLWSGLLSLVLLSAFALWYTHVNPLTYRGPFFKLLAKVQDDAGWNLSLQLSQGGATLWIGVGLALLLLAFWFNKRQRSKQPGLASGSHEPREPSEASEPPDRWMIQAGFASLLGFLAFYHRSTDHIMLAPTFLAMADQSFRGRRLGVAVLTALLGASLWTPARFVMLSPMLPLFQMVVWWLCAVVLAMSLPWPWCGKSNTILKDDPMT